MTTAIWDLFGFLLQDNQALWECIAWQLVLKNVRQWHPLVHEAKSLNPELASILGGPPPFSHNFVSMYIITTTANDHFREFISSHIYFASCLCLEQMRQQKRELSKTQRQLTRDQTALERQEKQLVRLIISGCALLLWTIIIMLKLWIMS